MIPSAPPAKQLILDSLLTSPADGPTTEGERTIATALDNGPTPAQVMAVAPIRAVAAYDPWARVVVWGKGMTELLGWRAAEVLGLVAPAVSAAVRPWFEWMLLMTLDTGEISTTLLPLRNRGDLTVISRVTAVRLDGTTGSTPHVLVGATRLNRSPAQGC